MKHNSVIPVREGEEFDVLKLDQFLVEKIPELQGKLEVEQFPGGFSNLTYLIKKGIHEMVLRRPPFGAKIKSGHDMNREYTILSSLINHYKKVPKPLIYSNDDSIIGSEFYIMERVQGVILRPKMKSEDLPEPALMSKIAQSLIKTMVELHQLDYEAIGLGNFGKPQGYVDRQINGWTRRYTKSKTDEVSSMEFVANWLQNNKPTKIEAALIHNDFKYDNVILNPNNLSEIKAILDWEMATLGDPLMDFGTSLAYWITDEDPDWLVQMKLSPTNAPGNPDRSGLIEMYAQASGKSMDHILFYYVYGLYKISVIMQQIYFRYKKGLTKDPRFALLNHAVKGCAKMSKQAIQKRRVDRLF